MKQLFLKSIYSPGGKESTTRLSAYIILFLATLFILSMIVIEIVHAINTKNHEISNEGIIVLGMLLTHHLALLGINKYHESKETVSKNENPSIK